MKQQFSDIGQRAVQDSDPWKNSNKMRPTISEVTA